MNKTLKILYLTLIVLIAFTVVGCNPGNEVKYSLNVTSFERTPLITLDDNLEVNVTIENNDNVAFENVYAKATVDNGSTKKSYVSSLWSIKANSIMNSKVYIPDLDSDSKLTIEFYDNKECKDNIIGKYTYENFEYIKKWQIGFSSSSHIDIGYTEHQEAITKSFADFLDIAMELCDEYSSTDTINNDVEFLYQAESSYILSEAYLRYRSADDIETLKDYIKKGLIGITASKYNVSLEALATEESARFAYMTNRYLVDNLGIEPSSMMRMVDNPSISKGTVDALVGSGIKYIATAFNGDRAPYYQKKI